MADFALGLHEAVAVVCNELGVSLGLRVGMHSGSVVAGVLGGARARFQIFGGAWRPSNRIAIRSAIRSDPIRDRDPIEFRIAPHSCGRQTR
jgi:class 3 adenylate cyclase